MFIATLLFHLGDLAFWCFSGAAGDELDSLQQQPGFTPGQAEEEVLGFRLRELTISLVREWRINELLTETLARPEHSGQRGKVVLLSHRLAAAFHFPVTTPAQHVFAWVFERQTAVWVDTQRRPELERLVPSYVTAVTGRIPFYVAPIVVNGRAIGLFYADRALSGRALDDDSFESFKLFAQQASLALSHLAQPR